MRLLKFAHRHQEPLALQTDRVVLRRPQPEDFSAWSELRRKSADFLRPFEPTWSRDELSRSAFRARLRRQESDINSGRGLPWFLFLRAKPNILLGGMTVSNIRRGVAETGTLGYWMGEPFAGQGYMRESVSAVCHSLFNDHGLNRIEAATILSNEPSQKLLESCQFKREGIARHYLKINGEWHDHILFARLSSDPT